MRHYEVERKEDARRRVWAARAAKLASFIVLLPLVSCSGAPPATYDLGAVPHEPAARRVGRGQLAVYEPTASLPADSQRIVIRTGPDAVAYLSGAQWADKLTRLVQSRLIESFENAHLLRSVGRPGLVADRNLQTDIRRFEADVSHHQAVVEISARLVGPTGKIVAGKIFSATAPLPNDAPISVTGSLDQALSKVMRDLVFWAAPQV